MLSFLVRNTKVLFLVAATPQLLDQQVVGLSGFRATDCIVFRRRTLDALRKGVWYLFDQPDGSIQSKSRLSQSLPGSGLRALVTYKDRARQPSSFRKAERKCFTAWKT